LAASAVTYAEGVAADSALTTLPADEDLLEAAFPKVLLSVAGAVKAAQLPGVTLASSTSATAGPGGLPGLVGPIPPPIPPFSPLLTPTQLAAFDKWEAGLRTIPPKPTSPGDLAYQVQVARPREYLLPTGITSGNDQTIAVDGVRPADGALIEAKNVRDPECPTRTLAALQNPNKIAPIISNLDENELVKYGLALEVPGTQARYLELDTNNEESVGYWQFLAADMGVKTNVRYIP
jgi:hypothetical protein